MTPEQSELPGPAEVLSLLEEAVEFAETMAAQLPDRSLARRIGEELIPALYNARTYLEVGYLSSPEIRLGISKASLVASDLTDADPKFSPLQSRLRVLQEEAGLASRAV